MAAAPPAPAPREAPYTPLRAPSLEAGEGAETPRGVQDREEGSPKARAPVGESSRARTQRLFREGERRSGRVAQVQMEKEQKEALAVAMAAEKDEVMAQRGAPPGKGRNKDRNIKGLDDGAVAAAAAAAAAAWDDANDTGPYAPSAATAFQNSPAGPRHLLVPLARDACGGTRRVGDGDALDEDAEESRTNRARRAMLEGGSKFAKGLRHMATLDAKNAETKRALAHGGAGAGADVAQAPPAKRARALGAAASSEPYHPLARVTYADVERDDHRRYARLLAHGVLRLV